jgi:hypothetical protein
VSRHILAIALALLFCACTKKETPVIVLPDTNAVHANLAFTCAHEASHLPTLAPQTDSLFRYARYLEKKDGPKDFNDVARYYRIAAANGHYKANQNLQSLLSDGQTNSPDAPTEAVDLAMQLIEQDVPSGYYDIGHYLETGYGLKQDVEAALRYFRKAADLGSPEAQAYVGEQLAAPDRAPDIAKQMLECAIDQGYGAAASTLGIDQKNKALASDAVKTFQKGVQAGNSQSASFLKNGFEGPPATDRVYYLGLSNDTERSRRYELIWKFLSDNEALNPKVPDIEKIVPLPPAKLPPWDGTFQWQKEQDAMAPPPQPSDELINQLAKAKNLDPVTGLPLAGLSSKTSAAEQPAIVATRLPIGTIAATGDPCPEDGIWCTKRSKGQTGVSAWIGMSARLMHRLGDGTFLKILRDRGYA